MNKNMDLQMAEKPKTFSVIHKGLAHIHFNFFLKFFFLTVDTHSLF